MKMIAKNYKIISILIVFFILGLLRINDLSLYTDSTRYVIWGNSVAHGHGFVDNTQPEPEHYIVNAPFYSIILAPVLLLFPLSMTAAKIWTLLLGCLAIFLFYLWIKSIVSENVALVSAFLFAFNPLTIVLSTEALSEAPFLCTIFVILILTEKYFSDKLRFSEKIILLLLVSIMPLLREVGITLILASIVVLFYKKQRTEALILLVLIGISFGLWTLRNSAVGIPAASQTPNILFIFEHFVTPPETSFLNELIGRTLINGKNHILELGGLLLFAFPSNLIVQPSNIYHSMISLLPIIRYFIFIMFIPFTGYGIFRDYREKKSGVVRLLFLVFYLGIIFEYPVLDLRFLFPCFPLALYYLAYGVRAFLNKFQINRRWSRALLLIGALAIILPNILCIKEILQTNIQYNRDPIHYDVEHATHSAATYFSTPWSVFGNWISKNIPSGAVIASPDKEIVPFAPNQKFLEVNRAVPLPLFEGLLRNNDATYIIAPEIFEDVTEYFTSMTETRRFQFDLVYTVARLRIFKIHYKLRENIEEPEKMQLKLNTAKAGDLFRLGRIMLKNERYTDALSIFDRLYQTYPRLSDIQYQRLIIHSFLLADSAAVSDLQKIYILPASASYLAPSRVLIFVMNSVKQAQGYTNTARKADEYYKASRTYWDFGYPIQARTMVTKSLQTDSTYFMALLWAWHYAQESHDQASSDYLRRLDAIDKSNFVALTFHALLAIRDSLVYASSTNRLSQLHMSLSRDYDKVDLPVEALDEAERAIAQSPENPAVWFYAGKLYAKLRQPVAAEAMFKKVLDLNPKNIEVRMSIYELHKGD